MGAAWARHAMCESAFKLQLLDVSFLLPLKTYCAHEIEIWLKPHPNRVVTYYQITRLVGKTYLKSDTSAIAANGFRKTGLFLCNLHMSDEHDPGRISTQHHEFLHANPVPYAEIAVEPPATSGANPQTLNHSYSACLT
jgi:hypothetical protein